MARPVTSSLRVVGGLDHDQENAPERSLLTTTLVVDNMQCGGCMSSIERALRATPGVAEARANLSARRVTVVSDAVDADVQTLIDSLDRAGFRAAEAIDRNDASADERAHALLRRLGVAGFAAANVMLLSVSVWAGVASDMDHAAQGLFHWLSALIAMPAIAYSAQPFFSSAATALKARRLNMDVPISLGITLATAMSLFQTIRGTEHVYFDAAIMLTFFLLIGRYLDELVRVRARGAAENLLGLKALAATVIGIDGLPRRLSARALEPGMRVQVAAGERIPVDGKVIAGETEVDASLITGETIPAPARIGSVVHAGTLNLGQPIMVEATATDDNTLVAEIARLMVAAEQGRGHYVRLADRAARLYSPVVHILGAATFIGWMLAGAGWEHALTCAIAVLIITCPCALALAVPAVQVAATSRLFAKGIIVKAADGLERLSEIDTVVFDKTGTLTRGEPSLKNASAIDTGVLARAAALAVSSRHPYALAVVKAARERGLQVRPENGVTESPGSGLMATDATGHERRLGSMAWVLGDGIQPQKKEAATLWYAETGSAPVGFEFDDAPKADAGKVAGALREAEFAIELLSGDREHAVQKAARAVGISRWFAGVRPDGKIARITALGDAGRRVLMVGDGLNDAPALAAAHASLSPSSAADISQNAADAVFQGDKLEPVLEALGVAQAAQRMAVQNFGIAIAYNIVSVPLAMAGHVTPLIAALAMSFSSIAVTGNALRLRSSKVGLARVERQSSGGRA